MRNVPLLALNLCFDYWIRQPSRYGSARNLMLRDNRARAGSLASDMKLSIAAAGLNCRQIRKPNEREKEQLLESGHGFKYVPRI